MKYLKFASANINIFPISLFHCEFILIYLITNVKCLRKKIGTVIGTENITPYSPSLLHRFD